MWSFVSYFKIKLCFCITKDNKNLTKIIVFIIFVRVPFIISK